MKILSAITARWMIVLACTVLGLVCALGYSLAQPRTYSATVRTYTSSGTADMVEAYQGSQAAQAAVRNFAVLAKDPSVAQRAITASGVSISVDQLLADLSVSNPPQTVILDVTVKNESAEAASRLARAVAQDVIGLTGKLDAPPAGGPGALQMLVVDPNTQGAVRSQLVSPMVLGAGGVGGLVVGTLIAVLLEQRRGRREDAAAGDDQPVHDAHVSVDVTGTDAEPETVESAPAAEQPVSVPSGPFQSGHRRPEPVRPPQPLRFRRADVPVQAAGRRPAQESFSDDPMARAVTGNWHTEPFTHAGARHRSSTDLRD